MFNEQARNEFEEAAITVRFQFFQEGTMEVFSRLRWRIQCFGRDWHSTHGTHLHSEGMHHAGQGGDVAKIPERVDCIGMVSRKTVIAQAAIVPVASLMATLPVSRRIESTTVRNA